MRTAKGAAVVRLLALSLLCLATLASNVPDWRYQIVAEAILPNLDFTDGLEHWRTSRTGVQLALATPPVLSLNAEKSGKPPVFVLRHLRLNQGVDALRVSVEAATRGVARGDMPWQRAIVALETFAPPVGRLGYWPHEVAALAGTTPWRSFRSFIPVNADAPLMRLSAYIDTSHGTLRLRNLSVDAARERPAVRWLRYGLLVVWPLAALWLLYPLLRRVRGAWRAAMPLLCGCIVLAGALTPQPQLGAAVGWTITSLAGIESALTSPESAPASQAPRSAEPAQTTQSAQTP